MKITKGDYTTFITMKCPICGQKNTAPVKNEQLKAYLNGALANAVTWQEAYPYLTPEERELLTSGKCYACQKKLFC